MPLHIVLNVIAGYFALAILGGFAATGLIRYFRQPFPTLLKGPEKTIVVSKADDDDDQSWPMAA